ncbi:sensor histidine kinase [Acetobacterium tundrae]|uniref:histidine kinase n=1 Tax=Acetobacterium tundrae TaxID=132932 RepID=A0ABR6WP25_9FIRM|nr:ATP-binding protein [Acetobacterium tundrae]MBC3798200.1 sensor histidine kinase [Acetobacterium tundrae]
MFKEIKRKITLFNTLILVVFMFVFILLLGFLVKWSLNLTGEIYLTNVGKEIIENNGESDPPQINSVDSVHDKVGYQFILWDSSHTVKSMKVNDRNLIMSGYELVIQENQASQFNTMVSDDVEYRVYTLSYSKDSNDYVLQIFQQITTEKSMIAYIISFLLLIGVGSIVVLIPLSYFLAGKSLQPIKETFEDQKKFIANASHELRTPLTVIQTNVEVLKLKEDEQIKDNMKWLNNIGSESETMAKLISDLLLLAQAENQSLSVEKELFDLSSLCHQMVVLMTELANEKEIELSENITPDIHYRGDEERLKQAVRILVDNAIKYTPIGGKVQLCITQGKRNIVIAVKDTGVGLTEEEKAKVFSRFYRVDDARNRETGGYGLGLNIADYIVKKHGGKIKIESVPNEGSTFSILLPRTNTKQDTKKNNHNNYRIDSFL